MADCEVWDLVRVPFPYTNRPVQQYRPALVVGRYCEAGSPTLVWALMVTSASHRRWVGDVEISDLSSAGLPSASIVRCAKIATVEERDAEPIGSVSMTERLEVQRAIATLLQPSPG